jgi:hypothetical protein
VHNILKKLKKNLRRFLAITGPTPKEFKELLPAFEDSYAKQYPTDTTPAGKARKRKAGGGRKGLLDSSQQLFRIKPNSLFFRRGDCYGIQAFQ